MEEPPEKKPGQKQEIVSLKNTELATQNKNWTEAEKADFAGAIGRVCALQRSYGKATAELETLVEGFAWALKRYPCKTVIEAMGEYIIQHPNIPTPSEIRQIIDPIKPAWKPDKSLYISLKQTLKEQGQYALNKEEIDYIHAYEEYEINQRRS